MLLVTHAETLFCAFAPAVRAASLRPLGAFVVPLITRQLAAEGLPAGALGPLDCDQAIIAKTADRQVLGCMNDIARVCQHAAADAGGLARLDLTALHYRLQRNITSARDYVPAVELIAKQAPAGPQVNANRRGLSAAFPTLGTPATRREYPVPRPHRRFAAERHGRP